MKTMAQTKYTIQIVDDYVAPTTPLATNKEYVDFVMNSAAASYQVQYNTATSDDGITAAREAFNASLPSTPPAAVYNPATSDESIAVARDATDASPPPEKTTILGAIYRTLTGG